MAKIVCTMCDKVIRSKTPDNLLFQLPLQLALVCPDHVFLNIGTLFLSFFWLANPSADYTFSSVRFSWYSYPTCHLLYEATYIYPIAWKSVILAGATRNRLRSFRPEIAENSTQRPESPLDLTDTELFIYSWRWARDTYFLHCLYRAILAWILLNTPYTIQFTVYTPT